MKKTLLTLFLIALSFSSFANDPTPTMDLGFNQLWIKNGAPGSTEVVAGTLFVGDLVRDSQTMDTYQILTLQKNPDVYGEFNNLTYQKQLTDTNTTVNTPRDYISINLDLNTPRAPSANRDTFVMVSLQQSSTPTTAANVKIEVDGIVIAQPVLSGVTATDIKTVGFMVPANKSYEIENISGSNTIVSTYELSF